VKTLTGSQEIRSAIRELLADASDERIAAVGFVGGDALSFIPEPDGLTVYCWPKPGGTNPDGIDRLMKAGATVHFVDRLHAKIYWSRAHGAIIGSANLTANALGDDGLREAVVRLPPGAFEIQPFIRSLKVVNDFAGTLRRLHVAHVAFMQRNPPRQSRHAQPAITRSFREWISAGDSRPDWRLGWYTDHVRAPKDAINELEDETGSRKYVTFLAVERPRDLQTAVFTLSFLVRQTSGDNVRIRKLEWWAPALRTRSRDKSFRDYPYVWFPEGPRIPIGTQPPFNHKDRRFRRALEDANVKVSAVSDHVPIVKIRPHLVPKLVESR